MTSMLDRELLTGGDGVFDVDAANADRLSSPGFDLDYRLTPRGVDELREFGIDFESLPSRRPSCAIASTGASNATISRALGPWHSRCSTSDGSAGHGKAARSTSPRTAARA